MRVILAMILAMVASAQTPQPQFDVVSVKPGDPADNGSSARSTPVGMEMRNATLSTIVRSAYHLNEYQLDGGPKWMNSAKFNIVAKYPANTPRDQISLMMQAMLAERFKLEFHRETKTVSEYALVPGKSGPKLQVTTEDDPKRGNTSQGPRMIKGTGLEISRLAEMLISAVGAPVIDRTDLQGKYNISLEFAPLTGAPKDDETLPVIFAALQEQLGLKLEPTKGPVEVLVVDRAEMPTAN
jgi:uncharacterized protein (TIGR03435 family)